MVFPLPLVPLEEHMLLDDRPAYPMNIFSRLRFSGRVEPEAFERAACVALERHPILQAVVRETRRGVFEWAPYTGAASPVHWLPPTEDGACPHVPALDIRRERGVRVWVQAGPDSTDVLVQVHHAAADGLGGFIFVRDLITAYAQEHGAAKKHALRRLDPQLLRKRGEFGLTTGKLLGMAHRQALGLIGAAQFYFRRAAPLVPHELQPLDSPLPEQYPAECSHEFTPEESVAHLAAAAQLGVTTNDLLCRDLFLALGDWRGKWGFSQPRDWLRMAVPINLRTVADRRMPAANVVSLIFLDRREGDFRDKQALLKSIHDQMQRIKRNQLGLTLVLSFRLNKKLPGGLKGTVRTDRVSATCIATNLGEVFAKMPVPLREGKLVSGNLVLESYNCLAPLRPHTVASFAMFRYAGRQCLSLHYEPRVLSREQAQDLLACGARRVCETVAGISAAESASGEATAEAEEAMAE